MSSEDSKRSRPRSPAQAHELVERLNLQEIHLAEQYAARIKRVLESDPGLRQSAQAARVFLDALDQGTEGFEHEWLELSVDRLQALRNLSKNLSDSADTIRQCVAVVIAIALDYRGQLTRPSDHAARVDDDEDSRELRALLDEIAAELESASERRGKR